MLYELHKFVNPVIKTNVLQYKRLYIEVVDVKILFGEML